MTYSKSLRAQVTMLLLAVALVSCKKAAVKEPPLIVKEDPATAATKANEIRKNTPAQLAEGLTLTLWASDSLAPDPVAMSIDDAGERIPYTYQSSEEFGIRYSGPPRLDDSIDQPAISRREKSISCMQLLHPRRARKMNGWQDLNHDGSS